MRALAWISVGLFFSACHSSCGDAPSGSQVVDQPQVDEAQAPASPNPRGNFMRMRPRMHSAVAPQNVAQPALTNDN